MPIPHALSAIEFPGTLRNPADPRNAIAALGGDTAISSALSIQTSASALTLNLRPHPTASHSNITSEKPYSPTNLFLLRITTSQTVDPPRDEQGRAKSEASVAGHVTSLIRFRTLADFQYHVPRTIPPHVPPSERHIAAHQVFEALSNYPNPSSVPSSDALLDNLRPRRFARSQPEKGITDYNFKQYTFPHLAEPHVKHVLVPGRPLGDDRRSHANRLSLLHHRVRMNADKVPERPPNFDQRPVQRGRETYGELYQLLVKLFDIRPIWIRRALFEGIPKRLRKSFKKAISVIAYAFQGTGPFYQAWIRYGYDPRKDPSARKYQVVEVRITNLVILAAQSEEYKDEDGEAKPGEQADQRDPQYPEPFNMPASFTLTKVPEKKNNFIQVCDIRLDDVIKVCEEEEATTEFDPKYGFFTEAGFLRLIATIKQTLFAICQERLGPERAKEVLGGAYNNATKRMAKKRNRVFLKDIMKPRETKRDASAVVASVDQDQETPAVSVAPAVSEAITNAKQDQSRSEVDQNDVAKVLAGEAVSRVADLEEDEEEEEDVMSEADDEEEEEGQDELEGETEQVGGASGVEGFEILGEGDEEDSEDDYM